MFKTVWVQGELYPEGHKHYPIHSSSPMGPLVQQPNTRPEDQLYIGHKRVNIPAQEIDHPTKKGVKIRVVKPDARADGTIPTKLQAVPNEKGEYEAKFMPVLYRWEYDPMPLKVVLTPDMDYIRRALGRKELKELDEKEALRLIKKLEGERKKEVAPSGQGGE